jgi:hypothetical protein
MPLVMARFGRKVPKAVANAVVKAIPAAVAEAFNCTDKGGDLTANDIEVEVSTVGRRDINDYDICITLLANEFPSRSANLNDRRRRLQRLLEPYIPRGIKGYLWTLLCPASFGEFHQPETDDERMSQAVEVLLQYGLGSRAHRAIKSINLQTVEDLVKIPAEELISTPNFGRKSFLRVFDAVKSFGLEPPADWVERYG